MFAAALTWPVVVVVGHAPGGASRARLLVVESPSCPSFLGLKLTINVSQRLSERVRRHVRHAKLLRGLIPEFQQFIEEF
jgi:hypothetical protein